MTKTILSIFFILAFSSFRLFACDCSYISPTFCEGLTDRFDALITQHVLRGKVLEIDDFRTKIKVKNQILGEVNGEDIDINYTFCDINTEILSVDEEYLFSLTESMGIYYIVGCAISILKIKNGNLIGNVAPGINSLKFNKFTSNMDCSNVLNVLSKLSLSPNPATEVVTIKNTSRHISFTNLNIKIYDAKGSLIQNWLIPESILPEEDWDIYIKDLPTGLYFIQIDNGELSLIHKAIKY